MHPFRRITVVGPGLLGGSVLLASKHFAEAGSIDLDLAVWARRQSPVDELRSNGVVTSAATNLSELFEDSLVGDQEHLVILATPIGFMPDLAEQIASVATSPVVLTDVGSTKGKLTADIEARIASNPYVKFVGSHPMAGSEKTGLAYASWDLFQNAACILTPDAQTCLESLAKVEKFWQWLGCNTSQMSPSLHDRVVARISHVPHVAAAALTLSGFGETEHESEHTKYSGGGFKDSTRIAGGAVEMWAEILLENKQSVTESLGDLIEHLESAKISIEKGDSEALLHFLAEAKQKRDQLNY